MVLQFLLICLYRQLRRLLCRVPILVKGYLGDDFVVLIDILSLESNEEFFAEFEDILLHNKDVEIFLYIHN